MAAYSCIVAPSINRPDLNHAIVSAIHDRVFLNQVRSIMSNLLNHAFTHASTATGPCSTRDRAIVRPQPVSASLLVDAAVLTRRRRLGFHLDTHCASSEIGTKACWEGVKYDEMKRAVEIENVVFFDIKG